MGRFKGSTFRTFVAAVASGLLAQVTAGFAVTSEAEYSYDLNGRLAAARYDNGSCVIYTYDQVGNRTAVTTMTGTSQLMTWGADAWGCSSWGP